MDKKTDVMLLEQQVETVKSFVQLMFSYLREDVKELQQEHQELRPELWLAALQVARATSAATFSVAPLLFKIDSATTSAASILTTFKRCANR